MPNMLLFQMFIFSFDFNHFILVLSSFAAPGLRLGEAETSPVPVAESRRAVTGCTRARRHGGEETHR